MGFLFFFLGDEQLHLNLEAIDFPSIHVRDSNFCLFLVNKINLCLPMRSGFVFELDALEFAKVGKNLANVGFGQIWAQSVYEDLDVSRLLGFRGRGG